jgi:hypothetical protein
LREIIDLAWERFTIITKIIGEVQSYVIATVFYFTILVPFGLGSRLFSDPLDQKTQGASSHWHSRSSAAHDLESAKRQG